MFVIPGVLEQGIPSLGLLWSWNSRQELGRRWLEVLCASKLGVEVPGGTNWIFPGISRERDEGFLGPQPKSCCHLPLEQGQCHPRALLHLWSCPGNLWNVGRIWGRDSKFLVVYSLKKKPAITQNSHLGAQSMIPPPVFTSFIPKSPQGWFS